MKMSKQEFVLDVWDNLMKNTIYNPTDFSKIKEDCLLDCDSNEIHIGNFILTVKENEDEKS